MPLRGRLVVAVLAALWAQSAMAYRPFDGTDADVLEPGEAEIELGALQLQRQGGDKSLASPDVVLNFGLPNRRELVFEGRARTLLSTNTGARRHTSFEDGGIFLKQVHREGLLQEHAGPSVASECGVLVPSLSGEQTGAACAAIISGRNEAAAWHFNAALSRNREGNWERFFGLILEGAGTVRPVGEIFSDRDSSGRYTDSVLVGAIWTLREGLAFDAAVRHAHDDAHPLTEFRLGLTWMFPIEGRR